ncbi:MAG TPA: hypothetical protein VFE10_18405 [Phenylobacterium sp.]|jgi:hypothetical protein|nr:hypothetical protein [Phenylobacterium sp.]
MRIQIAALVLTAIAGAAAPVAAQPLSGLTQSLDAQRAAEVQAQRSRDIALTNQTYALQARVQTDEALSGLAAARTASTAQIAPFSLHGPPVKIEMSQLAQMPDAELAASNARAVAASNNRR